MRMRYLTARRVIAVALIGATAGCGNLFQSDCISIGVSGIDVTVLSASGYPPLVALPTVRLVDGDYEELAARSSDTITYRFHGAIERPGIYSVLVEAPGYFPVRRDAVQVVRSGHCNYLQPVRLTVERERVP